MAAQKTRSTAASALQVVVVVVAAAVLTASSRHPAAAAAAQLGGDGGGCSSVMMTLSPCLDFISSKAPVPGLSCCAALAGAVGSDDVVDPRCLCTVLDGSAATSLGVSVNRTRALELPGVCKVKAPPVSQCTGPPGALAPTPPSGDNAATEKEEEGDAAADPPSSGNTTSASTKSKDARNLMASMMLIIPACSTLLYVF